jgi:hypothetical protein
MRFIDDWGNVYDVVNPPVVGNSPPIGLVHPPLQQAGTPTTTTNLSLNQTAQDLSELAALHATYLVGQNLVTTGTGDEKVPQDPTYVIRRPWLEAPEGSVPFDPETAIDLPAAAGNNVVVTLTVPDGYDGVINAYSWNFTGGGFIQGSGDLVVQLLRNGTPIRNYDNITVEKGSIAQARAISPLRIYSKDVISLVINHVANGLLTGNVIGSLVGYFYPAMS